MIVVKEHASKFVSPELCPPLTRERACSGNEIANMATKTLGKFVLSFQNFGKNNRMRSETPYAAGYQWLVTNKDISISRNDKNNNTYWS